MDYQEPFKKLTKALSSALVPQIQQEQEKVMASTSARHCPSQRVTYCVTQML